ncbi:MAG: DUF302 domain-containing protein [Bryobacterales bacterium]|nr:DUF302 domain-containing protein [Bryobacterales bacterium]
MTAFLKSHFAWGFYGLFLGAAFTIAIAVAWTRAAIIEEHESPFNFETTVQTIKDNAVHEGWRATPVEGMQTRLVEAGYDEPGRIEVIALCNEQYACSMLKSGKKSSLAMMPCSVAVYEKDGKVYVATVNKGLMGRLFRNEAAVVLRHVRNDENRMLAFLHKP